MGGHETVISNRIWRLRRTGDFFGVFRRGRVVGTKVVLFLAAGERRNIEPDCPDPLYIRNARLV